MFCLDEPDRHPSFSAANERTLAHAAAAEGRLVPFLRLDLDENPLHEATRCLDLGAKGSSSIRAHRSSLPGDPRLEPIFALAEERQIPILIHGGRGLPPIADELGRLVEKHPPAALIIAHAGIVDLAPSHGTSPVAPACSSTRPSGAHSICSTCTGSFPRSRSCTPPTTPTGGSRTHSSWRFEPCAPRDSTTTACGCFSTAPPPGSRTGFHPSRRRARSGRTRSPARHLQPDPSVPDDGLDDVLAPPARHVRRARARDQCLRREGERQPRGDRPDP